MAVQTGIFTTKDGQHVAVCFAHRWSAIPGPDRREAAFTCPVCAGEAEAERGRERFAALWAAHAEVAA